MNSKSANYREFGYALPQLAKVFLQFKNSLAMR